MRYLYGYLSREVERLTAEQGQGMGRTWRNNFRLGVVDTISAKLREQRRTFEAEARQHARTESTMALMRVDQALANIDKRGESVGDWIKVNLKLRAGSASGSRSNYDARQQGRKAGQEINVGGDRNRLTSAARKLTA